jgi:hypothetical protein
MVIAGSGRIDYAQDIQSINICRDLGREKIFELGRKGPYFKYCNFPINISDGIIEIPDNYTIKTLDDFPSIEALNPNET